VPHKNVQHNKPQFTKKTNLIQVKLEKIIRETGQCIVLFSKWGLRMKPHIFSQQQK
jgi:hypothetical protein